MVRIITIISINFLFIFSSCNRIKVNEENVPLQKGLSYFPENFFSKIDSKMEIIEEPYPHPKIEHFVNKKEFDTIVDNIFSEQLFLFNEPILHNINSNKEIYRFTKLNSFEYDFLIRIESNKNEKNIYWKILSKKENLNSDKIITNKKQKISDLDWNKFTNKLDTINFWNIIPNNSHRGFDGSSWLLEGFKNGKYYAIQYWSPKDEKFKETCNYLVSLTDIN